MYKSIQFHIDSDKKSTCWGRLFLGASFSLRPLIILPVAMSIHIQYIYIQV